MPIYEYQCQSCEHHMERLQRMSEDNLVDCPECGQPALRRLVSAAAFRLKGSGWYETDFKKDNKRNLADGSEKDKSDDKSSASDDKKPEEKASETTVAKTDSKSAKKPAAKPAAKESSHA